MSAILLFFAICGLTLSMYVGLFQPENQAGDSFFLPPTQLFLVSLLTLIACFTLGDFGRNTNVSEVGLHKSGITVKLASSKFLQVFVIVSTHTAVFLPLFISEQKGPFFQGSDGETLQIDNRISHSFSYPMTGITVNPLQGMGGNQPWVYNYRLDPGYQLLYHLGDRGFAGSHWFWLIALSISILFLVNLIKIRPTFNIPISLMIPYILLSSSNFTFSQVFLIAPHNLYSIAIVNTLIYIFVRMAFMKSHFFKLLLIANFIFTYFVVLNTPYVIVALPILLISLATFFYMQRHSVNAIAIMACSVLAQAYFCIPYVIGLFLDSAAFVYRKNLDPVEKILKHISVLFNFERKLSILIFVCGFLAALYSCFNRKNSDTTRVLGLITVVAVSFNLFYGLLWFNNEELQKGIRPLYFEFFVWVLVLIYFLALLGEASVYISKLYLNSKLALLPLFMTFVLALNFLILTRTEYPRRVLPPSEFNSFDKALDSIRIKKDTKFHGRLLLLYGDILKQQSTSKLLYQNLGTDFHRTMAWSKGIPTLNEFGHHISPSAYYATNEIFSNSESRMTRNILVYDKWDPKMGRLFGVKYVMSLSPVSDLDLKLNSRILLPQDTLFLYETSLADSGMSSPTKPLALKRIQSSISEIRNSSFDAKNNFLVSEPVLKSLPSNLESAFDLELTIIESGYSVFAKSDSYSVISLPIEYSNCFTLDQSDARLIRINGVFLGILFKDQLSARLTFKNGPFHNQFCRFRNFQEFYD